MKKLFPIAMIFALSFVSPAAAGDLARAYLNPKDI